jgi:hypothetical protein
MKKRIYLPSPARRGESIKYCAVMVTAGVIFLVSYKITVGYIFSGSENLNQDAATSYGGIKTGEFAEFTQTGEETCGHAVLAFFLTNIGFPTTEAAFIDLYGTDSMLSLSALETVFTSYNFKTQLLKVEPEYFRTHPEVSILHFSAQHFVVFLEEDNGEAVIFDPVYGKVYVSWAILSRLFSGYMLYIYNG